jgi:hypothetical protein
MSGDRSIWKGYQARIQEVIPQECTNFVELSEYADAAWLVRMHRQKGKQQQQQHSQWRRRRLDEDEDNIDETDDETEQSIQSNTDK